jgi:hypothetical protein
MALEMTQLIIEMCKSVPVTGPVLAHRVGRGIALLFHDRGTGRGVSGQRHAPAVLSPRERPGTHFTGGWVGPRAGLYGGKCRPLGIFFCKTCTLLFLEVYIIVPLYTCFVLCLVRVSNEFSGRVGVGRFPRFAT